MQLKSFTVFAASLALASASGWGDEYASPVDGDVTTPAGTPSKPTGPPSIPTGKPDGPKGPTGVADTTSATPSWSDMTFSTPVDPTTTSSVVSYWGDYSSVEDTTTADPSSWTDYDPKTPSVKTTTSSTASYWGDFDPHKTPSVKTTTSSKPSVETSTYVWSDYKPSSTPSAPVAGGYGQPPNKPVDGDVGKPPAGGNGCGVVTITVTNTATVTVPPGKPTPPPAPPVATSTTTAAEHTWGDFSAVPSAAPAPAAPASGGYMGIVEQYRAVLGLSDLSHDSTLEANALTTAQQSGGQLKHELNPGSMAQVLAPGTPDMTSFEHVFVGGWLCEIPKAGLDCAQNSQGWDYDGQTGHAAILTSPSYSKIGCACASGIWACDLA